MTDITIKIEIGENLAKLFQEIVDVTDSDSTESITAIMESFERMYLKQETYICLLCGASHFVGQPCNNKKKGD